MDTNEQLRDATDALTAEVHDLSGRLSAKELLYQRTQRLTRVSLGLAAVVGVVALVAVFALIRVNAVLTCTSDWGDASSERQDVLNKGAEDVAEKKGLADAALSVLVNNRNVDTATTAKAVSDYNSADAARITAEIKLQVLRDQYPPPQLEEFCNGTADEETDDPKGRGE